MLSLLTSIVVLAVGPVLHRLALSARPVLPLLDGFIFVTIGGLVLQHTVVESFALAGWPVVLVALIGFMGPTVGEKLLHRAAKQVHRAALVLAMAGLAFHAMLDGMALEGAQSGGALAALALAVILHRVPVSLTIWILLSAPHGSLAALGTLGLVALSTVIGFFLGGPLLEQIPGPAVGLFQALVAGSLLHVVVHRSSLRLEQGSWRLSEAAGALMGALLLGILVTVAPEQGHHHAGELLEPLLHYVVPVALVVAAVLLPRGRHHH